MTGASPTRLFTEAQWRQLGRFLELPPRQCEIAQLMYEGRSYKPIATQASISINKVRMHMRALFAKLGMHDRVSVVLQLIAAERPVAKPGRTMGSECEEHHMYMRIATRPQRSYYDHVE